MKKILISVSICLIFGGCRPAIEVQDSKFDSFYIKVREGYDLAEDYYSIQETEIGYDVVIHFRRK